MRGNDRRYYHYNIENNNIYFCENNYIIRNHQIDTTYTLGITDTMLNIIDLEKEQK